MDQTRWTLVLTAALLMVGCRSLEQIAPPVDDHVTRAGQQVGANIAALEHGRQIYLSDCVKCHTAEPIDRYTLTEWDQILPEMNDESNLTANEAADLKAYIVAAHRAMAARVVGPE